MNAADYIGGHIRIDLEACGFGSGTSRYPDTNLAPQDVQDLSDLPAAYGLQFILLSVKWASMYTCIDGIINSECKIYTVLT